MSLQNKEDYYDLEISPFENDDCNIRLVKKNFEKTVVHSPEEYDFPDGFYLHQGFELIGFDTCCYTNADIDRKEVRINLGFFFHRNGIRK